MDRISARTMAGVLAAVEVESVVPPDELKGMARTMFLDIAAVNRSRAWNTAHARILAEYCRLCVMAEKELEILEREGLSVNGRPNARLAVLKVTNVERFRLGKFLGLTLIQTAHKLDSWNSKDARAREAGTSLIDAARSDGGDLLA